MVIETDTLEQLRKDSARLDALLDPDGLFYTALKEQVRNLSFYGGMPDQITSRSDIDEVLGREDK
jgi:hypothetical protein